MTYLLDTNIITAILKNNTKVVDKINRIILGNEDIFINAISYYEIKRGLLASGATTKLTKFENLCRQFEIVLLDILAIFDQASEIYAELTRPTPHKLIEDADILIAALTQTKNLVLVSDDSHFNRISNLKTENWLN